MTQVQNKWTDRWVHGRVTNNPVIINRCITCNVYWLSSATSNPDTMATPTPGCISFGSTFPASCPHHQINIKQLTFDHFYKTIKFKLNNISCKRRKQRCTVSHFTSGDSSTLSNCRFTGSVITSQPSYTCVVTSWHTITVVYILKSTKKL